MSTTEKLCCICQTDVANKKRVKDSAGRYYCEACYKARRPQQSPPVPQPVAAAASQNSPADPGDLDLADPIQSHTQTATTSNTFACADCKKLVPEKQIRNDDGEFVCIPCFAKRQQSRATSPKPKTAKSNSKFENSVYEDDNPETWIYSIPAGLIFSAGVVVLAMIVFACLHLMFPSAGDRLNADLTGTIVYVFTGTIVLIIGAAVLMISMLIAARILGGIDFGYIGPALWKSLLVVLLYAILSHFIPANFYGLGFRALLLIACFMGIFRIDSFEAGILAVINLLLLLALSFAVAALTVSLSPRHAQASHWYRDRQGAPISLSDQWHATASAPCTFVKQTTSL